jgi:hypothetical protein
MILTGRTFVYLKNFDDKWNGLELTDDDLIPLEKYLSENPDVGDVIQGTGGLRKVRWALSNTSRSGGIRVLYLNIVIKEKIYMIDLFAKSEKENLTKAEKNNMKKLVTELKGENRNG